MLHKKASQDSEPCRHMRGLLAARQSGKLTGLLRWYTDSHVAQCPQCRVALKTAPASETGPTDEDPKEQSRAA